MLSYRKFCELIKQGETATVEFKQECKAFTGEETANDELAKDICALANNGNTLSYLIIGVIDGMRGYRSLENTKISDDALQNLCRDHIFPFPRVKFYTVKWKEISPTIIGVIEVGRHSSKTIFRLVKDGKGGKHRRNNVWIRRNAVCDLASPEEIIAKAAGKPESLSHAIITARDEFSKLSPSEQSKLITTTIRQQAKKLGYSVIRNKNWINSNYSYIIQGWQPPMIRFPSGIDAFFVPFSKICESDRSIIILSIFNCLVNLTKNDIELKRWRTGCANLADVRHMEAISKSFKPIQVKRITILPVLRSVPTQKITLGLYDWRQVGLEHYFYSTTDIGENEYLIPSSTELLLLDHILSPIELSQIFSLMLRKAEAFSESVMYPILKKN